MVFLQGPSNQVHYRTFGFIVLKTMAVASLGFIVAGFGYGSRRIAAAIVQHSIKILQERTVGRIVVVFVLTGLDWLHLHSGIPIDTISGRRLLGLRF